METLLVLAAALWFFYECLKNFFVWAAQAPPNRQFAPLALSIYCLIAGLILLWYDGYLVLPARH